MRSTETPRSPRLAILADDLTGALDCAAAFIRADGSSPPFVALTPGGEVAANCGVVSVNADSRRLSVAEAAVVVRRAAAGISEPGDTLRYVKIDSTLRGHPGLEIAECARQVSASLVIFAPSFPATGRTVTDGTLLVHGVLLAETEVGNDPLSPLDTSNVAEIIRKSTDLSVHDISLASVRSRGLSEQLAKLVQADGGSPVIACCDAESNEDLDRLITGGLSIESSGLTVLFAGSAGLAFALSRADRPESGPGAASITPFHEPVLVVTASQRELADRQIANLVDRSLAEFHPVQFKIDRPHDTSQTVHTAEADHAAIGTAIKSRRNVVLRATISGDLSDLPAESVRNIADGVTEQLGQLVARIVGQHSIGGLVIIGGDTAHAILTAIEARGIVLAAEPLPGVPVGAIVGGTLDGVPVATKAGAFGDDQTLVNLFQRISQGEQQH